MATRFSPKILLLAVALVGTIAVASDQNGGWRDWEQGKALYDSGKYDEALHEFRSHPSQSPQYFHNVGTLYLKLGQPGQAVAYLSKANRLRPHDPEIQHNLQIASSALGRLIGADRLDPASSELEGVADRASLGEVRSALGLLALIVCAFWLRAYLRTRSLRRTLLQPSGFVGLVGLAITLSLYGADRLAESRPPAFAVDRQVIRSGPGEQFAQLGQLEAGVKIRLLGPTETVNAGGQQQNWDQIRYSQDGIGWVQSSGLLLL